MTAVTPLRHPTVRRLDRLAVAVRHAARRNADRPVGLFIAAAADPISSLTGLSSLAEYGLGAFFVFCGLVVFGLAAAPDLRRAGIGVIIANIVFTVAAVVVVAADALPLTETGHRRDTGQRLLHRADRLPAIPRSAPPAGVTPIPPVRGAAVRGCGGRPRIGLRGKLPRMSDHAPAPQRYKPHVGI